MQGRIRRPFALGPTIPLRGVGKKPGNMNGITSPIGTRIVARRLPQGGH
jgi:hypothetical protein